MRTLLVSLLTLAPAAGCGPAPAPTEPLPAVKPGTPLPPEVEHDPAAAADKQKKGRK